jgi:hypothetical protein
MMPETQRVCARCHVELKLAQFDKYEDGATIKVFACPFCAYLQVETEKRAGQCDRQLVQHFI